MVPELRTCHAPLPEPPEPAVLARASARAAPSPLAAADALLPSHLPGAALPVGRAAAAKAASPKKPPSAGAGWAAASTGAKAGAGTAKTTAGKTTAARSSTPAALAFLDDRNLSVEDKLLRLLAYLNRKWEADLEGKLREAANLAKGTTSSGSSSSRGGVGGLAGAVTGAVSGAVKSLSGPACAAAVTAMGFPALAPIALKVGPSLVEGAVSAVASAAGGAADAPGEAKAEGSGSSDRQAQLKLMEIQRIVDQQKEMFSLVSNLLSSRHQLRMGVIQNAK